MFCVLWFCGWEAYSVWDARQKTDAIFKAFRDDGGVLVGWDDLTAEKQQILIKVVDPKFMTHKGVDFETDGAGKATITQSLARRFYFQSLTPGFGGFEDAMIAFFVIDPQVPKDVQVEVFLNVVGFGEHQGRALIGFDSAARVFFGKSFRDLSRFEFIQLVASLIDPMVYRPGRAENLTRASRIEKVLSGNCAPQSRRDVLYDAC